MIAPGALLCSCVSAGEGPLAASSGARGFFATRGIRPKAVANAAASMSSAADVDDGMSKVISDGRGGCYGGALSARALCVRGGSLVEVNLSAASVEAAAVPAATQGVIAPVLTIRYSMQRFLKIATAVVIDKQVT